ncbi:MAG: radical SAM protein [Phycisphaerae bacterium]|nr:radical SAM protein [Phycisphaerae bacterium]
MRILVLQLTPSVRDCPVPRFDPQLGTLLSLLRSRGHELSLLGLSRFDLPALKNALARALPQLVYADIGGVCVDLARRTLEHIERHEFLPVVAGGRHATVDPAGTLSLPGVHAVAIGEPDATLVTYLERMKDPAIGQVVLGVWLRDEQGLAQPRMPALVEDLDSLPFPERDLFGYPDHVRGTGVIEIATGRGCPQQCAYCINECIARHYTGDVQWVRRRSPENVLQEIEALRSRYAPVRLVRFLDHAFALDADWLDRFLGVYVYNCALPFRCHLRLNSASERVVRLLSDAACQLVDVELISGSDFVRNEIFEMDLSDRQITTAFEHLHACDIRTRVIVYAGSPYDSDAALDATRNLLKRLRPSAVDVRPYYPFPGTRAAETSRENGWIHARGEEQYHQERNGIDMPACRPQRVRAFIRALRGEFPTTLDEPWWRRWSHVSRSAFGQFFTRR